MASFAKSIDAQELQRLIRAREKWRERDWQRYSRYEMGDGNWEAYHRSWRWRRFQKYWAGWNALRDSLWLVMRMLENHILDIRVIHLNRIMINGTTPQRSLSIERLEERMFLAQWIFESPLSIMRNGRRWSQFEFKVVDQITQEMSLTNCWSHESSVLNVDLSHHTTIVSFYRPGVCTWMHEIKVSICFTYDVNVEMVCSSSTVRASTKAAQYNGLHQMRHVQYDGW